MNLILPASILFLTCLSLFIAMNVFICSSLDLGMLSLWVNPICALVTMLYHLVLIILTYIQPEEAVNYYTSSVAWAYMLSVAWLGAFGVMVVIACGGYTDLYLFGLIIHVPPYLVNSQKLQLILAPLEFALLGDLAVRITVLRRNMWKPMDIH